MYRTLTFALLFVNIYLIVILTILLLYTLVFYCSLQVHLTGDILEV